MTAERIHCRGAACCAPTFLGEAMARCEAPERLAYCPRCRRVVPVVCGRRGRCPGCGRVLPGHKADVMTKGEGRADREIGPYGVGAEDSRG